MCNGLAIIAVKDGDKWTAYGRAGNSSHDELFQEFCPDKHDHALRFEVLYPGTIRLDCPDRVCRATVVGHGLAKMGFLGEMAIPHPAAYRVVVDWLAEHATEELWTLKMLQGADLQYANLQGADLHGAYLQEADLREANLYGADLREANLREANLYGADLREANLLRADLREADLREADLWRANLLRADLWRADLRGANLQGADLHGAYLQEADLREANLAGHDIENLKSRGAIL